MNQQLLNQHFNKTLLGRIRLKLLQKISGNSSIPDREIVQSFILDKLQSSPIIGELYAAVLLISHFSWEYYDSLKNIVNIKKLIKALEKFPLEDQLFIEIAECPQPLPKTLGILIKSCELANVDHGFVYSVYLLGEEKLPEAIIDYIEVRACETMPDPIICSLTIDGSSTSDLKQIADSLTVQVALNSLYFFLEKRLKEEKRQKKSEIVKASKLRSISDNLSARFLRQASGKIELAIVIGEETSAEELRSAWFKIDYLRTILKKQQGTDLNKIKYSLLHNCYQLHENGWSYHVIAMDINYDCLINLCGAFDEIIDIDANTISSEYFTNAYRLLESVRMKEKEILDCLLSGLKEIRNGNSPWMLQSGPVDRHRVRDAIRQWEREMKSQKIIVKQPPKTETVPINTLINPVTKKYQDIAQELLSKTFPGSYEDYQKALVKTMKKTGYMGNVHIS